MSNHIFTQGNTELIRMTLGELAEMPEGDFHPPLDKVKVRKLAENFDIDLMEPPSIAVHEGCSAMSEDITGQEVIYEGRYRIQAAVRVLGPETEVWVRRTSRKNAAYLYERLNASRRHASGAELFDARVSRKNDPAPLVQNDILITKIAGEFGYTVGYGRGRNNPWHIGSTNVCEKIIDREDGEETLRKIFTITSTVTKRRMAGGGDSRDNLWGSGKILAALGYLFEKYGDDVDLARLIEVFSQHPFYDIAPNNENRPGRNTAIMVKYYNRYRRGSRLEPDRLPSVYAREAV